MSISTDKEFVSDKVSSLLSQIAKAQGPLRPPVDPTRMSEFCHVLSVEYRPMIPEGVLSPVPGGFRIYVQSNFTRHAGTKLRQRFTIAHELVHTFFFEVEEDMPKPIKGSPKGQRLETLCNTGAGQILVPDALLRREFEGKGNKASAESILDLARFFDVSAEVLMRRLHELGLVADAGYAAILVDVGHGGGHEIKAACYDTLLLCNASRPVQGMDFNSWVLPLLAPSGSLEDAEWVCTTQTAVIRARKVSRSSRSFILDLRIERATRNRATPDATRRPT